MSNPDFALAESISTTNATYFILVYVLILIYCCFGLAVVCDVYFVPALQKLSYTYDLPPDIAGSTLMALGASVPELFASLIGVFITEDDIGTGSIIGSSCFNLIAVPAACAFVASASFPRKLTISPMPVIRNSAFYAITILVLLLIIKDNRVDIPEAIILLLFFVMYIAFMIFCAQSKNCSETGQNSLDTSYISTDSAIHSDCNHCQKNNLKPQEQYGNFYFDNGVNEKTPLVQTDKKQNYLVSLFKGRQQVSECQQPSQVHESFRINRNDLENVSIDLGIAVKNSTCLVRNPPNESTYDLKINLDDHEENWVSSKWILVPMFPVTLSMKVLAPCKFKNTCWTIWTFIVSIVLIGALTYVSVWMVHLLGRCLGLPETVAGMTILSWGTGIPELIASIVLIKKTAQADMAICNTIGSNVIDVSFCLSLPWIVKCIINKAEGTDPSVEIQSAALPWTSFLLLVSVSMLILIFKLHNWVLSVSVGVWLSITYITFVVVATYLESGYSDKGLDLFAYI